MPNTPHNKPGQMRSTGLVAPSTGAWGLQHDPGALVVFGPPGSSEGDGHHSVIPGLKLVMGGAGVSIPWGTAAMVVKHNQLTAGPELCLLVKGFVGWTASASVFPIDDHIEASRRPSETTCEVAQ